MDITLINRTNADTEGFEDLFSEIARAAEKRLQLCDDYQISVTLVRSRTIHKINYEYRGIDRPTDVISFAAREGGMPEIDEAEKDLGDLFINLDYMKRQAREYGHSEKRELGFLFTHGLLHCLGYDHMNEEDEKVMFSLQEEILDPIVQRQ